MIVNMTSVAKVFPPCRNAFRLHVKPTDVKKNTIMTCLSVSSKLITQSLVMYIINVSNEKSMPPRTGAGIQYLTKAFMWRLRRCPIISAITDMARVWYKSK